MFLLPHGHIQIKTKLHRDEVEQRLSEQVEPRKAIVPGIFRGKHKYFEGEIKNGSFKINRVPDYRYSFTLVIMGDIQTSNDQTIIDMRIHLDYAVLITLAIFAFVILFIFVCLPLQFYTSQLITSFVQLLISALKWPLLLYLGMLITFNIKAYDILDFLNNLLAGNQRELK
jgi:hypothetical protein